MILSTSGTNTPQANITTTDKQKLNSHISYDEFNLKTKLKMKTKLKNKNNNSQ
tara:strand:+ start:545 stop:703 length:159 start_codon:yes stop_codon:yes gene_type:complete